MPRRLLQQIAAYVTVERTLAVAKFQSRSGWREIDRPILIRRPIPGAIGLSLANGGTAPIDAVPPEERGRIVICGDDGSPEEPAALWLTEVGQPVQPNSWEVVFARAGRRCAAAGYPVRVSPHQLRHYVSFLTMSGTLGFALCFPANSPVTGDIVLAPSLCPA
jgi:hypothetical protein